MAAIEIHVALIAAHTAGMPVATLDAFAAQLGDDVAPALEEATGIRWQFHREEAIRLVTDDPQRPAGFLDEASLRMVEGPYDAVVVVTDAALVSRSQRVVPGIASSVGRVLVVSTRSLRGSPRGEPLRALHGDAVRWNAATLLLHLLGHALGLDHASASADAVMSPFTFELDRRALPSFGAQSRKRLSRLAPEFQERQDVDEGTLSELSFHLVSAWRHPWQVLSTVVRSRAPFLPLHLPRLSTAAVAPAFILVFTAEIWDAGFHMTDREVWLLAVLSILVSTVYLLMAQNLFLPRKEKRFHTEHLAVVNVAISFIILLAMIGLFVMLGLLMLTIQVFIFPPDLIREWPSLDLESATITLMDQLRIATLISSIGVLTGSLAGGLESRDVLRHLALFRKVP